MDPKVKTFFKLLREAYSDLPQCSIKTTKVTIDGAIYTSTIDDDIHFLKIYKKTAAKKVLCEEGCKNKPVPNCCHCAAASAEERFVRASMLAAKSRMPSLRELNKEYILVEVLSGDVLIDENFYLQAGTKIEE